MYFIGSSKFGHCKKNAKGRPAGPGQRYHGSSFVPTSPVGAGPLALPRVHACPSKSHHQRIFRPCSVPGVKFLLYGNFFRLYLIIII